MTRTRTFATLALAGAAFGLAGAAQAQQAPAQEPAQPAAPAAPAAAPSDAQLRSFAAAALDIQEIRDETGPAIAAATGEERERLEREQARRLIAVAERSGLDRATFNRIAELAESDQSVWARIGEHMQEIGNARAEAEAEAAAPAESAPETGQAN